MPSLSPSQWPRKTQTNLPPGNPVRFTPGIKDRKTPRIARLGSGGQQADDLLNGLVGAVVGGFELAGGLVMGVGAVMEAAVGERAAEPFVEEQKEQPDLNPFGGEPVGVAGAVTLHPPTLKIWHLSWYGLHSEVPTSSKKATIDYRRHHPRSERGANDRSVTASKAKIPVLAPISRNRPGASRSKPAKTAGVGAS
jgi:hypothetical protein